ncbi:DUF4328 domain-containing protein [Robertkochia solimangrovi]|uniref:DUF4328 domain-containing protein n=1 Tax=Robertkochia solimangrovi TaxID=2213046 RepID=UPI00117F0FE6|nr:DUF4328 domain-containing protein [Robertkochia solimangrovi]TRZ43181.1 hypothetical protein DMZ48_10840 [Robertkochia solimangrovi]
MNDITTTEDPLYSGKVLYSNHKRSVILIRIFQVLLVLTVIAILSNIMELQLLYKMQVEEVNLTILENNDLRQSIIGFLQLGLTIASIVVFLNWFRRSYGNLHRLGVHPNQSESATIWTWFVPILNLFRPFQIMKEIWYETQFTIRKSDVTFQIKEGDLLLGTWWILFIATGILGRIIFQNAMSSETVEEYITGSTLTLFSDILDFAGAITVIVIVKNVSKWEARIVEEITANGGTVKMI